MYSFKFVSYFIYFVKEEVVNSSVSCCADEDGGIGLSSFLPSMLFMILNSFLESLFAEFTSFARLALLLICKHGVVSISFSSKCFPLVLLSYFDVCPFHILTILHWSSSLLLYHGLGGLALLCCFTFGTRMSSDLVISSWKAFHICSS